ncbi:hypothetical protein [uncultured Sphingomonas sp.]|uniref:hypothetical protein n=1 Tax=uncultured Sphingomonas sp. TaxID=158754 RepID=UPI0025D9D1C3|nr:hypothetical protein [uncultured Sphingomonas sp.]
MLAPSATTAPRPEEQPPCAADRHLPSHRITVDNAGVQQSRCRRCGCELRRLPTLRRWYRSGLMG